METKTFGAVLKKDCDNAVDILRHMIMQDDAYESLPPHQLFDDPKWIGALKGARGWLRKEDDRWVFRVEYPEDHPMMDDVIDYVKRYMEWEVVERQNEFPFDYS